MKQPPRAREQPWTPWLLLAVALHASGWLFIRPGKSVRPRPSEAPTFDAGSVSVELELGETDALSPVQEPAAVAAAPNSPSERSARGPRVQHTARPELGAAAADRARDELHSGELEAAAVPNADSSQPAEGPQAAEGPPLSLSNLGIGEQNPFVSKQAPRAASPREIGTMRFQRALAADILRAEQAVGLGPEGPALVKLEAATRTGNPEPNSNALFEFTTDSAGRLLSVELLESSSDPTPWRRIGRSTRTALGSTRLRLPKAGYGVTFRVRVVSHVELPSGADPGLEVNIAGIPVKKGRGPRSTRLDILNLKPELTDDEVPLPSGQTLHVPTLKFGNLLNLAGDPADIGAPERRMVRAHLESLTVNDHIAR